MQIKLTWWFCWGLQWYFSNSIFNRQVLKLGFTSLLKNWKNKIFKRKHRQWRAFCCCRCFRSWV